MSKYSLEQKKTVRVFIFAALCGVGYLLAGNRAGGADREESIFQAKNTSDELRLEYHGENSENMTEISILKPFPAIPPKNPLVSQMNSPSPAALPEPSPRPSASFSVQPTPILAANKWKVGIQVGHWKNDEVPDELSRLENNHGASGGGKMEWQVNYMIAWHIAMLLDKEGIRTELLPTVIPPGYKADAFIAVHADGNSPRDDSGFKIAAPWWDKGQGRELAALIEKEYAKATNFPIDDYIPPAMTHYYAFNYEKFANAIAPETPAVILEAGFLSNPVDQQILIANPKLVAQGVASGILAYLKH